MIASDKVSKKSIEANGITKKVSSVILTCSLKMLKDAPTLEEVADRIYSLMHQRIWCGHNIKTFDNKHLTAMFTRLSREAPKPAGIIGNFILVLI